MITLPEIFIQVCSRRMFTPTAVRFVPRLVHLQHLARPIQLRIGFMGARKILGSDREYVDFFAFCSSYDSIFTHLLLLLIS